MSDLKDLVTLIKNGDILNAVNLNKPIISLAGLVDSRLTNIEGDLEETFTEEEKTKLEGIEAGAEVNVNADWDSTEGDSEILNKPSLGTVSSLNTGTAGGEIRTNTQAEAHFVAQVPGKGLSDENFAAAEKAKVDRISVTKAIDLDDIAASIDGLSAAVVLKGGWDASTGVFPEGAKTGFSYIVTTAGVVDGVDFQKNDRLLALIDGASETDYVNNWLKLDYTDQVLSVAGRQGNIELTDADIDGLGTLATMDTGTAAGEVRTNAEAEAHFVAQEVNKGLMTDAQADKLEGIAEGAEVNVKSDWNAASGDAEILNKPVLVTSEAAKAGTEDTGRFWSAEKVHEAARAVNAKIEVSSAAGAITEGDGGKILVKNAASSIATGLPLGWNVIIAADGTDVVVTLGGSDVALESGEGSFTIPQGFAVSATKITSDTFLVHQLRLQLRVGL